MLPAIAYCCCLQAQIWRCAAKLSRGSQWERRRSQDKSCHLADQLLESLGSGSVSRGVSLRVALKAGSVRGSVPRCGPFGPRALECEESVLEVPGDLIDTLGTLSGHSGAQGPSGPRVGDSLGNHRLQEHSQGHSPGHFGPQGPETLCSWWHDHKTSPHPQRHQNHSVGEPSRTLSTFLLIDGCVSRIVFQCDMLLVSSMFHEFPPLRRGTCTWYVGVHLRVLL